MSTQRTKVPFTIRPHEPWIVEVTGADGKKYELSVKLAIFDVEDTGEPQASDPSLPTFNLSAQFVAETKLARS